MENYRILIGLVLIAGIMQSVSCELIPYEQDAPRVISEKELALSRAWQFERLLINSDTLFLPDYRFEPQRELYESYALRHRWLNYSISGTYEFDYDAVVIGESFVMGESENYQPNFGFWKFNQNGDSLIHNHGFGYETKYRIIHLSRDSLVREYERIIHAIDGGFSQSTGLEIDDTVLYRELLIPRLN